ncbi:MAG: ABC transporter permease [Gammaproteobacteria bacterium]|nr:MAG: ABC transporter permease [Gammaproteobacteria bacterium]
MIYLKLAWRNIWRNRRRTLITISAIVFAVLAAIVMQSMNRGSYEVMIDRMVSFNTGHIQVQDYRYDDEASLDNAFLYDDTVRERILNADPRITRIVPRLDTFMLAANDVSTRGSLVFGVNPEKEQAFNQIGNYLVEGRFPDAHEHTAAMGKGLADRLQLGVGDTLALIGQGRFGMSASGLFEIVGLIDHPIRDMNNSAVYLPIRSAQELLSAEDHITGLMISLQQERHTHGVAASLRGELDSTELVVLTWPELMPELLELMEMDLAVPRLLTLVLYVVIGFGFFGTVLTMTMERLREFGVLLSVGMKRVSLSFVVFVETLIISAIAVTGGIMLSWLLLKLIDPITLSGDAAQAVIDMGYDPIIPMSFAADQFFIQGLYVFLIVMAVFVFPLVKVLRLNILEAARS